MSTTDRTTSRSHINKDLSNPATKHNPFDTVFDGDDTDDEWWEEEDTPPPNRQQAVTPVRITQWPKPPVTTGTSAQGGKRVSSRQGVKRYSVQRPIRDKSTKRQKRQNAKAGIKLITNLTRIHPVPTSRLAAAPSRSVPQAGCFVDLAALQALNGESSQSTGFWKSRKGKEIMVDQGIASSRSAVKPTDKHNREPKDMPMPSPHKSFNDLSPNDRPIVIGLSIPSENVSEHSMSPQTTASDTSKIVRSYENRTPTTNSPETPTIIITPAQAVSLWSALDETRSSVNSEHHSPSSTYSPAVPKHSTSWTDKRAPPMPPLPASLLEQERQRIAGLKSCFSPDSDDATTWDDEETSADRSRVVSTCTVFEEDESPILERTGRARSMSAASQDVRYSSMGSLPNRRLSTGWWNYITTPFLTRSNTFANRDVERPEVPALPSLAIAAAKAHEAEMDSKTWEKQFSPLTPETTTTINSHQWHNEDFKLPTTTKQSPILQETRHKVQTSTGTLPLVLFEVAGLESARRDNLSLGAQPQLSRDNTISTFHTRRTSGFSAGDREVPMLIDAPNSTKPIPNNTYVQPRPSDLNIQSASRQVIQPMRATVVEASRQPQPSPGEAPPPPYSPPPARTRQYRAVFPPGHALGIQYPASPGPVSPGLQAAMSSSGAIPLSTVPLTPPTGRPINLNSGYPTLPLRNPQSHVTLEYLPPPSQKMSKAEARRQRHEKEEAVARRAGGWWRGRGCIPDRGCYGRTGAEGRKRRRWYFGLIVGVLSVIVLAVVLATQLHRSTNTTEQPSQWLNLTGFPPIFTGPSTIAAPLNVNTNTGCVFPSTQWSCDLPKELQESVAPNGSNQPNFILRIQWDNSTQSNATFANVTGVSKVASRTLVGNAVSVRQFIRHMALRARQAVTFVPTPDPPTFAEDFFLGNTTDGIVSDKKAGEPTPFYISFVRSEESNIAKRELLVRQSKNESDFPDLGSIIPAPSVNSDGTAEAANLLPFPSQQPIRLYDRGLPTEHYGFYTYYDRSIFLKSITRLNESNLADGAVPDDENGGARESEANFRCTWAQTRFLVQMWTRKNTTSRLLNSTQTHTASSAGKQLNSTTAGQDFAQPGSFPYPATITIDRHGGDPTTKMLYCYEMNDRRGLIKTSAQIHDENRGFGGTLVNKAPTFFTNSSNADLGGFDGGNGGCGCKWRNFEDVIRV